MFWNPSDDALAHSWHGSHFLWINPPWHYLPRVTTKLLNERPNALVVTPTWNTRWYRTLTRNCHSAISLPHQPLFRTSTYSLPLPPPTWHITIFYFGYNMGIQNSSWVRHLPNDGDIESNPGPTKIPTFSDFITHDMDIFIAAMSDMDKARQTGLLRARIRVVNENPSDEIPHILSHIGNTPSGYDALTAIGAYELFTHTTLERTGQIWGF